MVILPVVILLVIVAYFIRKRYRWVQRFNKLPCPFPKPFLAFYGTSFFLIRYIYQAVDITVTSMTLIDSIRMITHNSPIAMLWVGPLPFVMINKPDYLEQVLGSSTNLKKSRLYEMLHPWLGTGLLTSHGSKWKYHRKLLTSTFHFKILEQFIPIMNDTSQKLINVLKSEVKKYGHVRDLREIMVRTTLDVICETAMGEKVDALDNPDKGYFKAIERTAQIFTYRTWRPWLYFDWVFRKTEKGQVMYDNIATLHDFTTRVIESRKKVLLQQMSKNDDATADFVTPDNDLELNLKTREPFMDTLIKEHIRDPNKMSMTDVREEVDTFMFEGHDTTAWALIWAIFLIGHHPKVQEHLQAEVDEVFDGLDVPDQLTLDVLKQRLHFTEACIKESLRLFPSVPAIARIVETKIQLDDYVIPRGAELIICPRIVHRDPHHWPQPERFIPDRFMEERDINTNNNLSSASEAKDRRSRHPYAYIPFSAGVRNCIGQRFALLEEKAVIANVFRHFNVKSMDKREDIQPTLSLILKTNSPIRVWLEERRRNSRTTTYPA